MVSATRGVILAVASHSLVSFLTMGLWDDGAMRYFCGSVAKWSHCLIVAITLSLYFGALPTTTYYYL